MMSEKVVGILNDKIINLLNLDSALEGKEILLSSKRKKHMKKHKREFLDFEKSFNEINLVINEPNYVGLHPDGQSIQFIKVTNENILLAVKLDKSLDVRTMYVIKDNKLLNYLNSGRIKKF